MPPAGVTGIRYVWPKSHRVGREMHNCTRTTLHTTPVVSTCHPLQGPSCASEPAKMFGFDVFGSDMLNMFQLPNLLGDFSKTIIYCTLIISLVGVVGNGLVLWHLGFHIRKGALNTYLLNLAAADFLFLSCQAGFCISHVLLGTSQSTVFFVVTFLWFAAGLWLQAVFCTECCISYSFPTCCKCSRPKWTSIVVCAMVWVMTIAAVLMTARACGMLQDSFRLACFRYHAASIAWLATLLTTICGSSMTLFWLSCCSMRQFPKFYRVVRTSGSLVLICRLPFVLYWSLRPILSFLMPMSLPLATFLACIDSTSRPLVYYLMGRQRGKREMPRVILQRALGEQAQQSTQGLSLTSGPRQRRGIRLHIVRGKRSTRRAPVVQPCGLPPSNISSQC
ncbi:mas-related G-protein coupled receptor member G [Heterocephalus glaber]|uniref:Mas-related G-protein coupled receptor member G n=1 Tax=Heterocephalus glaber TaxID=10181 RepID=A0AAX6PJD5_HETGA|nr:mas-related G-protein coupled receptor member G [Heterocephalus glaber]